MVKLKINNVETEVKPGTTVLAAAQAVGFKIPTLCMLKGVCSPGSCRVCVVEIKNARNLAASCRTVATDGMEVFTNTDRVIKARKTTLELLMSDHDKKCLSCVKNNACELQSLAAEYGCDAEKYDGAKNSYEKDTSSPFIARDNNKCVLCRRCVNVCSLVQGTGVIAAVDRGFTTHIACAFERDFADSPCVGCGQCVKVCPVGALTEKDDTEAVCAAISDPDKYVVVGTAPSVRVALGEEFGFPKGTEVQGKMVSALKMLGFDKVFDVDTAADLTIMEEGTELMSRLSDKKAVLPMITSCSPGWVRFIQFNYPELLPHLSTAKSPQGMFGAMVKHYFASKFKIDPKKITCVTVMPCVAKKAEREVTGDVDIVITTRELARLIKRKGIDFASLPDGQFDSPIGEGTTAGLIFGRSGGVMEAALRTVNAGPNVKTIAVSGLKRARELMEEIKAGKSPYSFIEIMACPGGCVNGGGQPFCDMTYLNQDFDKNNARVKSIQNADKKGVLRKSHENPAIKAMYDEFFEKPNSHKAHELLHIKFKKLEKYPKR